MNPFQEKNVNLHFSYRQPKIAGPKVVLYTLRTFRKTISV